MLCAIIADMSRLSRVTVATTWDTRLGRPPCEACEVIEVTSAESHPAVFRRLASDCDAVFLIAPETGGILTRQVRGVEELGGRLLGSSSGAIAICTDKLRLAGILQSAGIPTIETQPFDSTRGIEDPSGWRFPVVIKPRDGAGSQSTFRVQSSPEFSRLRRVFASDPLLHHAIRQPYVAGHPVSVAVVLSESGTPLDVFPVAEQRLSTDGRFSYLGGQIPAPGDDQAAISEVALRACRCVPGLRGYVGVDLIVPTGKDGRSILPVEPLVVEINPRLTTSYLGYRALATGNLAERLLASERPCSELKWLDGPVTFDAAGVLG